jgi:hypothetical protein
MIFTSTVADRQQRSTRALAKTLPVDLPNIINTAVGWALHGLRGCTLPYQFNIFRGRRAVLITVAAIGRSPANRSGSSTSMVFVFITECRRH